MLWLLASGAMWCFSCSGLSNCRTPLSTLAGTHAKVPVVLYAWHIASQDLKVTFPPFTPVVACCVQQ
jgi:hypothetical protein